MKKQNGFSQIVIMVVMLILAIALPVTANLVKKVQDNRSSAAGEVVNGQVCTYAKSGTKTCVGNVVHYCTVSASRTAYWQSSTDCSKTGQVCKNGVCQTKCSSDSCSTCYSGDACTANAGCQWGYYNSSLSCFKKGSQPAIPNTPIPTQKYENSCSTSGSNSSKEVGRYSAISGKCYQCQGTSSGYRDIEVASSNCPGITCAGQKDQCSGNYLQHCDGTKWVNITCKAGCDYSNNTCKDECTIGQAATCKDSTTREYCNKDADGGIRLKTQTCSNGCEGGNCKAAPAPAAPDCSDAGTRCWGEAYKAGCTGTKLATDNNCASKANYCAGTYYGTYNGCGDSRGCLGTKDCTPVAPVGCGTSGTKRCDGKGTLQICNGTDWVSQPVAAICEGTKAYNCDGNITVTNYFDCATSGQVCVTGHCVNPPINGALGPANGTIVTTKPTSSGACSAGNVTWTDGSATDGTYNWTCAGINGGTSVNGSANKADCTVGNQKCTTGNKYYTCADGLWANSKTTTACATGKVCTNGEIGTAVCRDPAYTAPKLNLYFAISGVKKIDSCFGNLNFNVSVTKDGSNIVTSKEVTATIVDNKFNDNLGDQVFKISNFDLTNDYALTDKIKITIGSSRKTLTTIYGKDSQNSGFPALNKSQILVSSLVNNVLSLYNYPVLNGDIGTQGSLGTQDKVVNGADFAFMKNEWGKTCKSGENLNADLNGDCRVDTFDLQILKNAMAEQYSQKTD